jgi:metal-dependent amidase/aminoacylase/carboxypeptidase family protein
MNNPIDAITKYIDEIADELLDVSHQIHANPELAFKEEKACSLLAETLTKHDLEVETGVFTLPTAFETTIQGNNDGPTVALIAEYDALPGIGHA